MPSALGMHRYFTIATGEILKGNNIENIAVSCADRALGCARIGETPTPAGIPQAP